MFLNQVTPEADGLTFNETVWDMRVEPPLDRTKLAFKAPVTCVNLEETKYFQPLYSIPSRTYVPKSVIMSAGWLVPMVAAN